jgi:hypothetical protein
VQRALGADAGRQKGLDMPFIQLHATLAVSDLQTINEQAFLQTAHFLAFDVLSMLEGLGFKAELRFNGVFAKPKPKPNPSQKTDDTPASILIYFLTDHGTASLLNAYKPTGPFQSHFNKAIPPGALKDKVKGEVNFLLMPAHDQTTHSGWNVQSTLKMPNLCFDDRSPGFPLTSTIPTNPHEYKRVMELKLTQGLGAVLQKHFLRYR